MIWKQILYQKEYDKCVKDGFFTEKQQLDYLIFNGLWSNDKEKQIENIQKTLVELYDNKKKVYRIR